MVVVILGGGGQMHNYHIDGGTGLIFNFGAFIQFQKYYEETLIGLWGSTVFSTVCQKQIAIIMFPFPFNPQDSFHKAHIAF